MIGYDISWAGFNIIEVMSSNKFTFKRIGYLAASQSFHQDTEVSGILDDMLCEWLFVIIALFSNIFEIGTHVNHKYDQEGFE